MFTSVQCPTGGSVAVVLGALLLCAVPSGALSQQLTRADIERFAAMRHTSALAMYREYLALPNDAHFPSDLRPVIDWLAERFRERGFAIEELETGRIPLLFAERAFAGAERTVLVYLQSDGQPVDTTKWDQESPYKPVLKQRTADGSWREIPWERLDGERDPDWRIFARSTSDSKGQNVQFLAALSAMDAAGVTPDFNIKVIVDTEEELGSPNLPAAVERYRDKLAADMLVIFDGPPHASGRPTLDFGARGIATFTLTTYGPRVPQHSGHYGNWAPNPALRLSQILASMKDEHGRVTIPGFYDGITIDPATKAILDRVPDDEAEIKRALGIAITDSVAHSLQEARQYPSLNIRGLSSGWVGSESRTIIPATATAEVDVRLVLESDPTRLLRLIREHIESLGYYVIDSVPTEEERLTYPRIATFTSRISYAAYRTDFDTDVGRWLSAAMIHFNGEEPIMIRTSGGSIPISPFVTTLGVPAVSVSTVNPDNNQHSPNENIRLGNFLGGISLILAVLAQSIP